MEMLFFYQANVYGVIFYEISSMGWFWSNNTGKVKKKAYKLIFTTNTAQNKMGRNPIFLVLNSLFSFTGIKLQTCFQMNAYY